MQKRKSAKKQPAAAAPLSVKEMFPKTFATLEREAVKLIKWAHKEARDALKAKKSK